ncbi:MAG: hypothetical protein JKY45_00550 [Emcibacter sp.]|nr:hypothetical protein [Emcibacter sp.]
MATNDFTPEQQRLILKAQKVIDKESAGYVEILQQHLQGLQESLKIENTPQAIHTCYLIQSQAGTFGWPLASELAGWFKRILQAQKKNGLNPNISALFCQSFTAILQNELKAESDEAVKILKHIESVLKKEGVR